MKTIIVPTDFSSTSVNAAYYAVDLARRVDADVMLLHVVPLPITVSEVPMPPDTYVFSIEEANRSLKELREKLEIYCNYKLCISYKASTGSFLGEIEGINRQRNIFALIMSSSRAGATEAFFLGSFCLAAAKHLNHPLVIIPPGCSFKGIHKIGLACDMRNVSETVPFQNIKRIFDHFDAKLEVLYVSKQTEKMYPQVLAETKDVQNSLAALHPEIRITTNEDIGEGLQGFVQKSDIDLLILVPKERSFVESLFHRSLTKQMVLHPKMPIMILH